jgi:NAD(P)H-dependent FMN reductase
MHTLQVIVGSTRPTRAADQVARWVMDRARRHPGLRPELLDLREWPLPMFGEHFGTIGDFADPTYSDPIVRSWNAKIREGDAYLVITPEYNRSIPAVLKNAIDSVFVSFAFRNKPVGTVAYSGGITGGARAAEHLTQIAVETEAVPLRSSVSIPNVETAFSPEGTPSDPAADARLGILLDDLAWWAAALDRARADGELPPAVLRMRAAATAAAG